MDGNGRWAHQHGVPVAEGHKAGADTVKARLRDAVDLGVRELTIYSFSTENWSRPQDEVDALMALFSARIIDETPELHEEGVKMRFVGRREGVLPELIEQMEWAEAKTADEHADHALRGLQLRRALGDPRRRASATPGGGEEAFRKLLYAPEMHDPDLLIRTSRRAADLQLPAVAGGVLASCTSPTCCGPISRARTSKRRWPATRRVCAASGGAERGAARRRARRARASRARRARRTWSRGSWSRSPRSRSRS